MPRLFVRTMLRGAVALSCLVFLGTGCRTLRCYTKESDETIALTRQLALQGKDAQQKGQWDKAEAYFAEAVQKSPADERARLGYAESLWQRGDHNQAVVHMQEAVKLSGSDPDRLVQLGQMYLAQQNYPAAMRQADKAIAANKHLAGAWALRASVLRECGQNEEALAAYHRALSFQPHYPDVQLAVAEIYGQSQRPQRALATLQALADQFPPGSVPPDLMVRQAIVLRQLGRHHDAAECLASAAQASPNPDVLRELAVTRLQLGDMASATTALSIALQLNPQDPRSLALQQEIASRQQNLTASLGGAMNR